jgi:hypothetical protein
MCIKNYEDYHMIRYTCHVYTYKILIEITLYFELKKLWLYVYV